MNQIVFIQLLKQCTDRVQNRVLLACVLVTMLIISVWGRFYLPNIKIGYIREEYELLLNMDILYAPLFIFACVELSRLVPFKFLNTFWIRLGTQSLLMWFVSCIFFNVSKEIFQPILYFPKNPIFVMIWGTAICYICAVILDFIIKLPQEWITIQGNKYEKFIR